MREWRRSRAGPDDGRRESDISEQLSLLQSVEPNTLFHVRESHRARRMSIHVHPHGQVEVIVPRRTRAIEVRQFVETHRDWIARARRDLGVENVSRLDLYPRLIQLRCPASVFSVEYRAGGSRRLLAGPEGVVLAGCEPGDPGALGLLQRWLREQAKRSLVPRLAELAGRHDLHFVRTHIRLQRTRWGSCSSSGIISLNAAALFLEPGLVDYLLLHELCHTRHLNHSRRFWALLERAMPGARQCDRELNRAWRQVPPWVHARG